MFPTKQETEDTSPAASLMSKPHYADEETEKVISRLCGLLDDLKKIQEKEPMDRA